VLSYLLNLLTVATIYASAAVTLQLMVGETGLLSVAQAVFLALGSYSAALVSTHIGHHSLLEIAATVVLSTAVSLLISVPSLRLKDDYFAIMTFSLQMIVTSLLSNWIEVTNGPFGIGNIPPLSVAGFTVGSPLRLLAAAGVLLALTLWIAYRIVRSRFGLALRAVKSDELSGILYAHFLTYIDPSSFGVMDSIFILSMVIIGGQKSPFGAACGAIVLIAIPEGLRFLGMPSALAANLRQIVYGSLLVLVVLFRPEGLFVRNSGNAVRRRVPDAAGV